MARCANPECPNKEYGLDLNGHWVQVQELNVIRSPSNDGPIQHVFAAVTCSKRCAIEVLTPQLPAEDEQRRGYWDD